MDFSGQYDIPAAREKVWDMLNDPAVLRDALPGCQSLTGSVEEGFTATVRLSLGPVRATFEGSVTLRDIEAPVSYTIAGAGKGGIAGFASGAAHVALAEIEGGTQLRYTAEVTVGGKIAQLGARLLKSSVAKLTDQFFQNFVAQIEAQQPKDI